MRIDYNIHKYARTLRFFEAYYPYDTEKVNYAELMLSMDKLSTIDELFSIRNRILDKYFDMEIILLKMPEDACQPMAEGSLETFGQSTRSLDAISDNKRKDVNGCFNANIIRLFKESNEPTLLFCGECIVNMSKESANYNKQIKEIVQYAKEVYNIDAEELSKELCSRKTRLDKRRIRFDDFKEGMNGYLSVKQEVQEDLDYIMKYNWRLTNSEKDRYCEFLPREMRNKTDKSKNDKPIWDYIIPGVIILAILIFVVPWFDVLLPWLLAFVFILWCFSR